MNRTEVVQDTHMRMHSDPTQTHQDAQMRIQKRKRSINGQTFADSLGCLRRDEDDEWETESEWEEEEEGGVFSSLFQWNGPAGWRAACPPVAQSPQQGARQGVEN